MSYSTPFSLFLIETIKILSLLSISLGAYLENVTKREKKGKDEK
jgi:hypothetical protein